jgi:uncharacterized phage protein (TIGR02218 family)
MKTIPSGLATHYALQANSLAQALRITRTDAQVFAFTSADRDVTISSVLYQSRPGLAVTSLSLSAGLNVDNLEITTLDDGSVFSQADVLQGRWRNADFVLFEYNWASPSDGINSLMAGTIGEVYLRRGMVVAELRGLQQYLQQPVGNVSTKNCRARLGDSLCTVNLAPFTFTGSVTAVASNQVFTDSTKAQAAEYFTDGSLTWTSGPNAGLKVKVKSFASSVFTLSLPMLQTVAIGHTFSVVAGCTKRFTEDCKNKFNNVLNFQGEPHRPTVDDITKSPRAAV